MFFLVTHAKSYNLPSTIQRKKKTYLSTEIGRWRSCGLRETGNRFYLKHHKLCQLFISAQTFERKTPVVCCCNFRAWEIQKQPKSITVRSNKSTDNATRWDISASTLAESRTGCFKLILNTYLHEGIFPLHEHWNNWLSLKMSFEESLTINLKVVPNFAHLYVCTCALNGLLLICDKCANKVTFLLPLS